MFFISVVWISLLSACNSDSNSKNAGNNAAAPISLMKTDSVDASAPSLTVDNNGNVLAVWSEGNYGSRTLWMNRFELGRGWGTAESIGTGIGDEGDAKVALNTSGSAVLVWRRDRNNSMEILAVSYTPVSGWGAAVVLDSSGLGIDPQVTVDDGGNATAFWIRYDSVNYTSTAMTARYTSNGWDAPQVLANLSTPVLEIAGNNAGKVVAIWNESDPVPGNNEHKYNTWVRQFSPETGWLSPQPVGNDVFELNGAMYSYSGNGYGSDTNTPGHYSPRVAIDDKGDVLAFWSEVYYQGDAYHTMFKRYEAGKGWGAPQELDNVSSDIALDDSGSAYVCLTESNQLNNNSYLSKLSISKYTPVQGWVTENIVKNSPYFIYSTSVIVGKNGLPVVLWLQSSGYDAQLWSICYSQTYGWGTPIRLDKVAGTVDEYHMARDATGNVTVIWTQYFGNRRVVWAELIN